MSVNKTLDKRGERYGIFTGHVCVTQELKRVIRGHLDARHKRLDNDQHEALDMICHKIGRIINGDANYSDSWHDIAGYATLIDERLKKEGR